MLNIMLLNLQRNAVIVNKKFENKMFPAKLNCNSNNAKTIIIK